MVGRKLAARLMKDGKLGGRAIAELHLHDVVAPLPVAVRVSFRIETHISDLAVPNAPEKLIAAKPDIIFHLAGIVSGEAETNFDLGYRVNFDGTRSLFDAIRTAQISPRVVFTSSIAVYG